MQLEGLKQDKERQSRELARLRVQTAQQEEDLERVKEERHKFQEDLERTRREQLETTRRHSSRFDEFLGGAGWDGVVDAQTHVLGMTRCFQMFDETKLCALKICWL